MPAAFTGPPVRARCRPAISTIRLVVANNTADPAAIDKEPVLNNARRLRIADVQRHEWDYRLRLPFRFGGVTKTHGRQVVMRARVVLDDGRSTWGQAAESLSAKWFDKNPVLSDEQNHDQLRRALELAEACYQAQPLDTAFGHADRAAGPLTAAAARQGLGPLIAGFGAALIDRCVLDALGRLEGRSFWSLMQGNGAGLRVPSAAPDLQGFDLDRFVAARQPALTLAIRHTVGMVDPITAADLDPASAPDDGLPRTLQEVVRRYGHRHFKLKLGGRLQADIERLQAIAAVLDGLPQPYQVTLDGNEQFPDAAAVVELLRTMQQSPALTRLYASTLWIEQPLPRDLTLTADVRAIDALRPVIIDESDGDLDAFPSAQALGYRGVSSKNCKGLYKSLLNLARCAHIPPAASGPRLFMSAEDLTTLPGLSLQQDLALVALLGLPHAEKNAHHFVDGMQQRPMDEQQRFVAAHPDLYRFEAGAGGASVARLQIVDGQVHIASLGGPGFACAADIDWQQLAPAPASRWMAA